MIYYFLLALIDIYLFLSEHWKELTFTAAASAIGMILGKRIGFKLAVNQLMKYMGMQQKSMLEQQVEHHEMEIVRLGGQPWIATTSKPYKLNIRRVFLKRSMWSQMVRSIARFTKLRTNGRKNMKNYLKKLGKTKFQAFLIITFTNIIMLVGSVTGYVDIDGKVNEWMPAINLIVQLIATMVYTSVEGSIDKASLKATGQEYTTGETPTQSNDQNYSH